MKDVRVRNVGTVTDGNGSWRSYYKGEEGWAVKTVAESLDELRDLQEKGFDFKLYLGTLCKHGHEVMDADGVPLGKTIRFHSNHGCKECKLLRKRKQTYKKLNGDTLTQASEKFTKEDYDTARDLGLTIQEYKEMIK